MNILSIQSHVVLGHAGNAAAVFPLQRIGVEVWPVHTVQFSSHTGYGPVQGEVFSADLIRRVVADIDARGVLGECDGILSGYVGSVEIGEAVLQAVDTVRHSSPHARYCCDPVIGDKGRGIFVQAGIPEFMRERAVPAADVITPNQFELDFLSGRTSGTMADMHAALDAVHALGPRIILVTSLHTAETPRGRIDLIVSDEDSRCLLRTPDLSVSLPGAGDAIAALFFAHFLESGSTAEALSRSASSLFCVLRRSVEEGSREMLLIAAQDEFVTPGETFSVHRL